MVETNVGSPVGLFVKSQAIFLSFQNFKTDFIILATNDVADSGGCGGGDTFDKFIQIQRYINLAKCRLTKKVLLFLSTALQAKQEATPVRKIWGEGWQIEDDKHQQTHSIQN